MPTSRPEKFAVIQTNGLAQSRILSPPENEPIFLYLRPALKPERRAHFAKIQTKANSQYSIKKTGVNIRSSHADHQGAPTAILSLRSPDPQKRSHFFPHGGHAKIPSKANLQCSRQGQPAYTRSREGPRRVVRYLCVAEKTLPYNHPSMRLISSRERCSSQMQARSASVHSRASAILAKAVRSRMRIALWTSSSSIAPERAPRAIPRAKQSAAYLRRVTPPTGRPDSGIISRSSFTESIVLRRIGRDGVRGLRPHVRADRLFRGP